jgi:hypothetical protein
MSLTGRVIRIQRIIIGYFRKMIFYKLNSVRGSFKNNLFGLVSFNVHKT